MRSMDESAEPSQAAGPAGGEAPTEPATAEVPVAPYPPGYVPGPYAPGFAGPPPGYGWAPPPPGYGWAPPAGPTAPPPGYSWMGPSGVPASASPRRGSLGGLLRNVAVAWAVAGVLALTVVGLSVSLATTGSSTQVGPIARAPGITAPFGGRGGVFGRQGVIGTVASVGSGSFTVTDRSGTTVTVDEQSSTTYYNGSTQATSSIVTAGANVVALGSRSGNTVTATRVILLPPGVGPLGP